MDQSTGKKPASVDAYIAQFDGVAHERLVQMRAMIRAEAGEAEEKISWAMPTYVLHGNLVHFAGHKTHVGFYPGVEGVEKFIPQLEGFHTSKGGIQFPYAKPLPEKVIREIVRFRVATNTREAAEKQAAKAAKRSAAGKPPASGAKGKKEL